MKTDIHPAYNTEVTVTCACGNTFVTGSTQTAISFEVCSACHPFYTGKQKFVDTARRVEKFQERAAKKEATGKTRRGKTAKHAAKKAKKVAESQ